MPLDQPVRETGYAGWDNGQPPPYVKGKVRIIQGPGGVKFYFQPPIGNKPGFVVFPGKGWISNVNAVDKNGSYIHTEAGTGGVGGSVISLGVNNGQFGMSRQYIGNGPPRVVQFQMPPTFSGQETPYKPPPTNYLAAQKTAPRTTTALGGGAGGGGGGGGYATTTTVGSGLPQYDPNSKVSINAYGYIAKLAKAEPDLARLMAKYAKEDLGNPAVQARLEAEIRDTKWYTSHSDAWRQGEIKKATDPATFAKDVNDAVPNVKAAANEYLIPMSDASAKQWATKLAMGQVTEQQYTSYIKEQAKSLFPGMGPAIDSGVTTKQYVQPYADVAAQTLEVDPASVNFLDPKWSKALFQVDPKTKERTSMSLADWQTTLRTDPSYGYDKTQQAKQQASALTTQLAKTFGALG